MTDNNFHKEKAKTYKPIEKDPTPRKKPSNKKAPKKASHKHDYIPVVLTYRSSHIGEEKRYTIAGKKCKICGRLDKNFPEGSPEYEKIRAFSDWMKILFEGVEEHFPTLPVIEVENIFKLH